MHPLQIHTFGRLRVRKGDEPVTGFETRKVEALLVYLACNRRAHPREVLADLLWDERSQRQTQANLRVVLLHLRKLLGEYFLIDRKTAALHPEPAVLIRGQPLTPRTDIYSLGLLLYELLAGEMPFQADSLAALIEKQLHEPLPSLRTRRPELPPAVEEVLHRATQRSARLPGGRRRRLLRPGSVGGAPARPPETVRRRRRCPRPGE